MYMIQRDTITTFIAGSAVFANILKRWALETSDMSLRHDAVLPKCNDSWIVRD